MDVIDAVALAAEGTSQPRPVCVLLRPDRVESLTRAAERVGVAAPVVEQMRHTPPRRPLAQVDDGRISLIAFTVDEVGLVTAVHMHVGDRGLLVLCTDDTAPTIRRAVTRATGPAEDALVAALLAIAQLLDEAVQRLLDNALKFDAGTTGLTSGARRRAISRERALAFSVQQLAIAHRQLLVASDHLTDALPSTAQPGLRRADATFDAISTTAGHVYALLGDTLNRQATIINERLTLVAVIFFPLTVSTGYFGMNFGWLTKQIGSAAAFALLGLILPCLLVAATLLGARWLVRD